MDRQSENAALFDATASSTIGDVTEQILRNQYPLHFACRNGDEEQVKTLLESRGCFVYEEDGLRGWTPTHWAAFSGSLKCLMLLSEHGLNCDITTHRMNQTPSHIAAVSGKSYCLKWLLHNGAALGRQLGCLRALGCRPGNLDVVSSHSGVTAIHVAAQAGHACSLRWLLKHGNSCVQQDFIGDTPLHKAAQSGSLECVILLVAHGASLSLRNHHGRTPVELAQMNKHKECEEYLQQALHALQTGVVPPLHSNSPLIPPLHSNNPLILMNGEPIYECQNKPDCSRLMVQAADQEMDTGEEAMDMLACQEGSIVLTTGELCREQPGLVTAEETCGIKRSRDEEDGSDFKRQRCFESSLESKYGTYNNNNILSSYHGVLAISAEPSKGEHCLHSSSHPQVHGFPLPLATQSSLLHPMHENSLQFRGLSSLLEHCQSLQLQSRYDTALLHCITEDGQT